MFDVTQDDIAQLNDIDLRELVGRLCEAELESRGLSSAAVTYGGSQTAADGGLDVRVALPMGTASDGYIPRLSTGFQVKTPNMPRAAIIAEMRPGGVIRPVIQALADEAGAYIIVSSRASTSDSNLRKRRDALCEALTGVSNAAQLKTDFYDGKRLASWVRQHPGLNTWVKNKLGRGLAGWQPYGSWSGAAEDIKTEYLVDDKLRLHLGRRRDAAAQPVAEAIDELRDELAQPRKMLRLVGLSGVGKTRFVQALFDARIGLRPLPPSLAIYTNLSDNPDPQPTGLASYLIANNKRAILVVDNCTPDLHRTLSQLCIAPGSKISVLTVEYDVREDQPEATQVVTLDTSSPELIEKLIRNRLPHVSEVDARTIADASGGNARIALAIAGTVEQSETVAGLSDDQLFQRLFRQRHDPNDALLLAAQACSLVYSFQGEALAGHEAELPRLAVLANQTPREVFQHVGELLRRELVQQRGVWRAVLPHALANRLAARALEDTPDDLIDQQLVAGGMDRLARSFSRRLSFLHEHPRAIAIVERWLSDGGLLGDATSFNHLFQEMFENVAPVSPGSALATLERASARAPEVALTVLRRHRLLLRSLAYDAPLFERSVSLLVQAATQSPDEVEAKDASGTFTSLFAISLSGTHATIEQRLGVIERLLRSRNTKQHSLGLAALETVLEATHFSSGYRFEFGARSRDYGYQPKSVEDISRWYGAALALIERFVFAERILVHELGDVLARKFRGLWISAQTSDGLERLARKFAADGFWREGWVACRQTMQFDRERLNPASSARLANLEAVLEPSGLSQQVQAVVLGDTSAWLDLQESEVDDGDTNDPERIEANPTKLGEAVATNEAVFSDLLPDLLKGGNQAWAFGRGLASASKNRPGTWSKLVEGLAKIEPECRNVQVLRGFLSELWERERDLAQDILDDALDRPVLIPFLPVLHTAVQLDERGSKRLKLALTSGQAPIWMYRNLAYGRATESLAGADLRDLLALIAEHPDGFDVAQEILYMRLHSDQSAKRLHEPEILEAGRGLLQRIKFKRGNHRDDHTLAGIVRACLSAAEAAPLAAEVAKQLRRAIAARETYSFDNHDLLKALLTAQPMAVLDGLFEESDQKRQAGAGVFEHLPERRSNPADAIPIENLIAWCNENRERRYPLVASFVTFGSRSEESELKALSEQAKALLANAPDPKRVLNVFVERFLPRSWSGSLAVILENRVRLLDSLDAELQEKLEPAVAEAKAQLMNRIAQERERELAEDRERDGRFE